MLLHGVKLGSTALIVAGAGALMLAGCAARGRTAESIASDEALLRNYFRTSEFRSSAKACPSLSRIRADDRATYFRVRTDCGFGSTWLGVWRVSALEQSVLARDEEGEVFRDPIAIWGKKPPAPPPAPVATAPPPPEPATTPAPPPPPPLLSQKIEPRTDPKARYSFARDGDYGYESVDGSNAVLMVRFFGERDSVVQWGIPNAGSSIEVFECSRPCTFVRVRRWLWRGGGFVADRTFRVPSGSVMAAIATDALNRRLQVGSRCWASENYLAC